MQSEFACHAGLRAKFFCRICWAEGGEKAKESEAQMIVRITAFMKVSTFSDLVFN